MYRLNRQWIVFSHNVQVGLCVGKFIIGYVPACGVKEYYVASACEELYAPPSAYVGLYGLLAQASFLGGEFVINDSKYIIFT